MKGDQLQVHQPIPGTSQCSHIQTQSLANALVTVIAQALGIGDGDEKQVQGQRAVIAQFDVMVTHQALVNPTELGREAPGFGGVDQLFVDHNLLPHGHAHGVHRGPTVTIYGQRLRCHLVTQNR